MGKSKIDNVREKNFEKEEIRILIQIWGSAEIQDKFSRGLVRHNIIYEEISQKMKDLGFSRSGDVVKKKIANLKGQYNVEKRQLKSGSSPSSWEFWSDMHVILGSRPLQNNDLVDDSLNQLSPDTADVSFQHCFQGWDGDLSENEELTEPEERSDVSQNSVKSPSACSTTSTSSSNCSTSSSAGARNVVIRRTASKRAANDSMYLKQLVDIETRYFDLAKKKQEEDEAACTIHKTMLAAATKFFNSYSALAEKSLQQPTQSNLFQLRAPGPSTPTLESFSTTPSHHQPPPITAFVQPVESLEKSLQQPTQSNLFQVRAPGPSTPTMESFSTTPSHHQPPPITSVVQPVEPTATPLSQTPKVARLAKPLGFSQPTQSNLFQSRAPPPSTPTIESSTTPSHHQPPPITSFVQPVEPTATPLSQTTKVVRLAKPLGFSTLNRQLLIRKPSTGDQSHSVGSTPVRFVIKKQPPKE